jgi:hypothetical protein
MLSAIRRRREAAPSWWQASISRAPGPRCSMLLVTALDKRKEPEERCILDVRLACQNSDFDCEASPVSDVSCRFGRTPDSRLGRRLERTAGKVQRKCHRSKISLDTGSTTQVRLRLLAVAAAGAPHGIGIL